MEYMSPKKNKSIPSPKKKHQTQTSTDSENFAS